MLIVGDLSGIQDYLFDIADQKGGQSRSLRARSFFLQAITEIAALRLLHAAEWAPNQSVLRAAGKFVLQGPSLNDHYRQRVLSEHHNMTAWLAEQTGIRVRMSVVLEDTPGELPIHYHRAMRRLQQEKLRPLSSTAIKENGWNHSALVLPSIAPPCIFCHRQKATHHETDADGNSLALCPACAMFRNIGRELPFSNWMTLHSAPEAAAYDILRSGVSFHPTPPSPTPDMIGLFSLSGQEFPERTSVPILKRKLARHIPVEGHFPLDFDQIAAKSQGANYLGVLKMDADSLGKVVHSLLENAADLEPLQSLSERLDDFFALSLDNEMKKPVWESIYTVFSGGDDLLLVGPWNVLFSFALHVRTLFQRAFHDHGMSISGGMAIVSRKTPIYRAVEQAEHLLESAKHAGRDRFAAFGQVWEWKHQEGILFAANNLKGWIEGNTAERGWLQTLLRMTERQTTEPLTAARLSYHVERNYPRLTDNDPNKHALRKWIDYRVKDFDNPTTPETRYLPAILRYALIATRKGETNETR